MFACISDDRKYNYVSGFSNGGYGCLHSALKYPSTFSKVGAFSAGDKADSVFVNDNSTKAKNRILLFGDKDIHNTDYCLTYLADKLIADNKKALAPDIYHACGSLDPWLDMNHIVRDYFLEHNDFYNYTYDELEGLGHEWKIVKLNCVCVVHITFASTRYTVHISSVNSTNLLKCINHTVYCSCSNIRIKL